MERTKRMGVAWHWTLWNLFLALIPVASGWLLAWGAGTLTIKQHRVPWIAWLPLALLWLAFLPNTCYLLTEWRHFLFDANPTMLRQEALENPSLKLLVAEQGLFFAIYSAVGVLCFALSLRPISQLLRKVGVHLLPLAVPFFFLTSLGVYMGLIVRLNSWDILTRPAYVLLIARHALTTPSLLGVITVFALLLWILYEIVDIWVEGVEWRLQKVFSRPS